MADSNPPIIDSLSIFFGFPDKTEDIELRKKLFLREDKGDYAFKFFKEQYRIAIPYATPEDLHPNDPNLRNKFNELIEEYSNINTWKSCEDENYEDEDDRKKPSDKKKPSVTIYKLTFSLTESHLERLRKKEIENKDRTSEKTASLQDLQAPKPHLNEDKEKDLLSTATAAVLNKYNEISAFFQSIIPPQPQQKNDTSRDETLSEATPKTASSQNSNSPASAPLDLVSAVHDKYLDLKLTMENKYVEISDIVKNLMPKNTDNTPKSKESLETNSSSLSNDSTITASSQSLDPPPPTQNPGSATYSLVSNSFTSIISGVSNFFQSLIPQSQQDKKESASKKHLVTPSPAPKMRKGNESPPLQSRPR